MKWLTLIVVTTIVCQIVASPSPRRHRGYSKHHRDYTIDINPNDPFIHPPWWSGPSNGKPGQYGPFGSQDATEISHGENYESSSEEDQEDIRQHGPGYGIPSSPSWWRPQSSSTTQRNIPTRPPSPTENKQEQIALCIRSCPVTTEYNPVCGSNNVTYANPGRLQCEQICGIDVQLTSPTACSATPPNEPVVDPSLDRVVNCVRNCPVTSEYNPVCGSNNVTYANEGRLECDQYCGIPVQLIKRSSCSSAAEPSPRPLTNKEQIACLRSCPVTVEYNPVCGSNNVTYSNPGRLECAQNCGVVVTLSKLSSCGVSEPVITTENTVAEGFAAICLRSCPVTSEYNPVCGSNNVTYENPGRLECAQNCGVAVTLVRQTSCEATITKEENKDNTNDNGRTTTEMNVIPTTSNTTPPPYINSNGNNASSGNNEIKNNSNSKNNDGKTGTNGNEDSSSKNNGQKGDNNFNGGNNNEGINGNGDNGGQSISNEENEDKSEIKGRPGYSENNANNNCKGVVNNRKPPSIKEVMACMQKCSLTSEPNPVCGTDSVTYMNPGRLLCAQFCGVDVRVKKFAPCGSSSTTNVHCLTTCTNPPVTDNPGHGTPPVPSIEACMEACPASLEFKPVCGSNNVTYRNLEKLQCAIRCGIDISIKRNTHCSAPEIDANSEDNLNSTLILDCIQHCYVPHKYQPICASNNVTYNNTGHLVCARQCGLDIEVKQLHACSTETDVSPTPTTSTTTEKMQVTKPEQNGLNFTIDPDLLANIWGTSTPKDEDEDFELDQRVQDKS